MLNSAALWNLSVKFPPLAEGEVHLWQAALDYSEEELDQFIPLLSIDEDARAKRFHFAKDRIRYTAARGILRKILAGYLNVDPQAIEFQYNSHGKPFCVNGVALQFNLSHSKNIALYAFANNQIIGIDIEAIDPDSKVDAIANRFFSASEAKVLERLTGEEKIRAFFNGWTRKEAILKAMGQVLSYTLKKFTVTIMPNEVARLLAIDDPQQKVEEWFLYSLDQIPGFAAALVTHGEPKIIKNIF